LFLKGFETAGKITQNKVVIKAEKSIGTIKDTGLNSGYVRDLNASRPVNPASMCIRIANVYSDFKALI
jgi:hypothetical protein